MYKQVYLMSYHVGLKTGNPGKTGGYGIVWDWNMKQAVDGVANAVQRLYRFNLIESELVIVWVVNIIPKPNKFGVWSRGVVWEHDIITMYMCMF